MLDTILSEIPHYHYKVGNQVTVSKSQALIWAGGDTTKIEFYFMDHVWDSVDWSREPNESFQSMCRRRCHQLRDNYDYLCLWLSGGYDSQTVLACFIDAGIKIDEIAYMDRSDYYDDPELPSIKSTIQHYRSHHNPNLMVHEAKVDFEYHKKLYHKLQESWILEPGWCYRVSKSIAPFIHKYHEDTVIHKERFRGRRADIYGKEKPRLNLINGKWYMHSADLAVGDIIGSPAVEFFTTADMPEIHVKQTWMAIRYFESLPEIDHGLVHTVQSNDVRYYASWNLALGRVPLMCAESRDGINKAYFSTGLDSLDSRKMARFLLETKDSVFDLWKLGRQDLDRDPHYVVMSRAWPVCEFGKFLIKTQEDPVSDQPQDTVISQVLTNKSKSRII